MGTEFAVADEVEGLGIVGQSASSEAADFAEPASGEHGIGAFVNAPVKGVARRLETNFEDAPAGERSSSGAMDFGEGLSREQANFYGADEFLFVGGRDLICGLRIQMLEHPEQVSLAVLGGGGAQAFANFFRALWEIG